MKVGVVGLGYVGLPLAVAFAEEGHEVVGLDADPRKIDALAEGRSYIEDVSSERLAALDGKLTATSRYPDMSACDAVIICVPTPLTNSREPDLSYMVDAATSLAAVLQKGQLIVLESTTYPGTTRERLRPILEESGLAAGQGLPPRLLARADRPGPHRLHDPHHARRWSEASTRRRRSAPSSSTRSSATRSSRSAAPTLPSSPSCSRTSSARSTSRSSTRWRCSASASGSTSGR